MYPGSLGEIRYPYAYFTVLTAGTRELMSSLAGTVQGYSTEYIEDDNLTFDVVTCHNLFKLAPAGSLGRCWGRAFDPVFAARESSLFCALRAIICLFFFFLAFPLRNL